MAKMTHYSMFMTIFLDWKLVVTEICAEHHRWLFEMWGKKRTSKISFACCLSPAFPLDSPRSFWWYHLICWLLSAVGVVCILVAHEHYSVDVVVAYFITSRLFWWYHTMANLQV